MNPLEWFACLIIGHTWINTWEEEWHPGFGAIEVEKKECIFCGRKEPTGSDRPIPKHHDNH